MNKKFLLIIIAFLWVLSVGAFSVMVVTDQVDAHGFISSLWKKDSSGNLTPVDSSSNVVINGTVSGRNVYGDDITGAVNHNTTDLHGKLYHFTAAATVTLDAAADAGYGACVGYRVRDASEAAVIDVQAGEKVNLDGTALAAGTAITATGAGSYVMLCATTDTDGGGTDGWETWGNNGFESE